LTAGAEDFVIAYGGGAFSHNSRGDPPTPNKHLFLELKRRIRCRLVPEFRTVKLCSLCDNELVQSRFWSIKSCNEENCWTRWNCDVNGARNIRRIFLHMSANGGEKPSSAIA
jgi:transposase